MWKFIRLMVLEAGEVKVKGSSLVRIFLLCHKMAEGSTPWREGTNASLIRTPLPQ